MSWWWVRLRRHRRRRQDEAGRDPLASRSSRSPRRVGGTWWDNQYPGAEVDVASHVYSFPFKRVRLVAHPRQASRAAELPRGDRLRLGAVVAPATRRGRRPRGVGRRHPHATRSRSTTARPLECDVLIAATGFLNVPQYPTWPGLDDFDGPKFHTSRWEHEHDLTGKTGRGGGHRFHGDADHPRDRADRGARCTCSSASRVGSARRATTTTRPSSAAAAQPALLLEDAAQGVPPAREGRVARRHLPSRARR